MDKVAIRQWIAAIRDILDRQWDPIGGCPPDEYDRYAGKISTMLRGGADDESLLAYLAWAETVHMGLPDSDLRIATRRAVVAALRALGQPPYIPG